MSEVGSERARGLIREKIEVFFYPVTAAQKTFQTSYSLSALLSHSRHGPGQEVRDGTAKNVKWREPKQ